MDDADGRWMQHALELAERGRGYVEPNPLVGAVVVRQEHLVGKGWHQRFGEAHAEVHALAAAGDAARNATLYVTLEPCCHQGKTPPCTQAVLRSGVKRVVAAMLDPFPEVHGRGVELLQQAGLDVTVGVGAAEAHRLNAPYLKLLARGRPYVHVKWAMSLDGKIATASGSSKWISSKGSRAWVHAMRGKMDAIAVGCRTAQLDDPLLTVRPPGPRTPVRVVLCGSSELSLESQLVKTAREAPVLVVSRRSAKGDHVDALRAAGCEVLHLAGPDGQAVVEQLLDELGRRRMTNMLVEGGSALLGSFRDAGEIDEAYVFIAPCLIGGAGALAPIGGRGVERVAEALELDAWTFEQIDRDILIHGRRQRDERP
jgi:diaminohydroxyphosphoribosylaminopyrimidine deaminase/5-amino-6-(5-phosphoribosylamino)uracil reductase